MDDVKDLIESTSDWGGWATLAWGLLIAAIFAVTLVSVMGAYIAVNYGDVSESEIASLMEQLLFDGTVISLATLSTFIIGSLVIVGIIKFKKHSQLSPYLGLTLPSRQQLRYWLTIFISLLLFSELLSYLFDKNEPHEFMVSVYTTAEPLWLLPITMVVAARCLRNCFLEVFY